MLEQEKSNMTDEKKKRGRWRAGESGNPAGRKPGTGTIGRLREGIASELPEVIAKLVELAKSGDVAAARLLLERVLPAVKATGTPVSLSMPEATGDDLFRQGVVAVEAVFRGELSPDQGNELLAALTSLARIREIGDGERHIRTPEEIAADIRAALAAMDAATGAKTDPAEPGSINEGETKC